MSDTALGRKSSLYNFARKEKWEEFGRTKQYHLHPRHGWDELSE
jgi:hypothetical protein